MIDRTKVKSKLAVLVSDARVRLRVGALDQLTDKVLADPEMSELVTEIDPANDYNYGSFLAQFKKILRREYPQYVESYEVPFAQALIDKVING